MKYFFIVFLLFSCLQKIEACNTKNKKILCVQVRKTHTRGLCWLKDCQAEFIRLKLKRKPFDNAWAKIVKLKEYPIAALCEEELACLASEPEVSAALKALNTRISFLAHHLYWKNLENTHFPFENLSHVKLKHVNFKNSYMPCTKFRESNLSYSDFTNATLQQADFLEAKLKKTIFTAANLIEASFHNAFIESAILSKADISFAIFTNAKLKNAQMQRCHTFKSTFMFADLEGADLSEIKAESCNMAGTNLTQAFLMFGVFKNTRFDRSNLTRANLCGANLENATLSFSNMEDVILSDTQNQNVTKNCIVKNANFYEVKGLSPTQKLFLIQNGALNVPE